MQEPAQTKEETTSLNTASPIQQPEAKKSPKPAAKKRRKKLTLKQQLFVKEYVANKGNGTQAALKSYDTVKSTVAHAISTENLRKPSVIEEIRSISDRLGMTLEYSIGRLKQVSGEDKLAVPAISLWKDIAGYGKPDITVNNFQLSSQEGELVLESVRNEAKKIIDIS